MIAALARIGRIALALLAALGRIVLFTLETFSHLLRPPFYPREFGHAVISVGWQSLPVVALTALFTGGALALQIYSGGARLLGGGGGCRRSWPSAWCANWARCWWG